MLQRTTVFTFNLALPFTGWQKHYPVADKLSQAEICMDEEPEYHLQAKKQNPFAHSGFFRMA